MLGLNSCLINTFIGFSLSQTGHLIKINIGKRAGKEQRRKEGEKYKLKKNIQAVVNFESAKC